MQHKVLAYVVRREAGALQLLVFEHAGVSDAGVQVPAGTLDPGETLEAALWRELFEESGLRQPDVVLLGKLVDAPEPAWDRVRHVYLLTAVAELPDMWSRIVAGDGQHHGMVFKYRWVDIAPGPRLAAGQDRWLALISGPLLEGQARS